MSYTPTSWHKGDKVTTEKLNKIEQGIVDAEQSGSDNRFIITLTPTNQDFSGNTNVTIAEISEAYLAGKQIIAQLQESSVVVELPAITLIKDNDNYYPYFLFFNRSDNIMVVARPNGDYYYNTDLYMLTPVN